MTGPEWTPQPVDPPTPQPGPGPGPVAAVVPPVAPGFVVEPAPSTVRVPGLDPSQVIDDDATEEAETDADEASSARSGGLAALFGRLFRRRPAGDGANLDADGNNAPPDDDPEASPPPADPADPDESEDESDIVGPPKMRSWRPSTWGWETRVGLAAVVSFLILIGVFINRRGRSSDTESDPEARRPPKVQIPGDAAKAKDQSQADPKPPALPSEPVTPPTAPVVAQGKTTPATPVPAPSGASALAPTPSIALATPPTTEPAPAGSTANSDLLLVGDATKRAAADANDPASLPIVGSAETQPTGEGKEPPPLPKTTDSAPILPEVGTETAVPPASPAAAAGVASSPTPAPAVDTTPIPTPTTEPAASNPTANPGAEPPALPPPGAPPAQAESPAPIPGPEPAGQPAGLPAVTGAGASPASPPPNPTTDPIAAGPEPAGSMPAATPTPDMGAVATNPEPASAAPVHPRPLDPSEKPKLEPVPAGGPGDSGAVVGGPGLVVIPNSGRRPGGPASRDDDPPGPSAGVGLAARRRVPDGPAPRDEPSPSTRRTGEFPRTVRPNENFYTISREVYGEGRFYKALWDANRDQVADIKTLYIGTVLWIPRIENLNQSLIDPPTPGGPSDGPAVSRASTAPRGGDSEPEFPSRRSIRAAPRQSKSATPEPRRPTYRVARANETLRSIARDTLGDPKREGEILDLNRDQVSSVRDALRPNMTLTLPEDAVLGRRPR